jgi:hypothetical protein
MFTATAQAAGEWRIVPPIAGKIGHSAVELVR